MATITLNSLKDTSGILLTIASVNWWAMPGVTGSLGAITSGTGGISNGDITLGGIPTASALHTIVLSEAGGRLGGYEATSTA